MLDKRNPGLCFSPLNGAVWAARPFTKQRAVNCSLLPAFCLCESVLRAVASVGCGVLWTMFYSCGDHTETECGAVSIHVFIAVVKLLMALH